MKPDASKYNTDPAYLRRLIDSSGVSQVKAAELIGVKPRSMRRYLASRDVASSQKAPYVVQFALECLAENAECLAENAECLAENRETAT